MYAKPKLPMKKRTILILTILAAGLLMWKWLACGYNPDKPTEFYPILTRLNDGMKHEAFVVSNAPCDTCELRKVVEKCKHSNKYIFYNLRFGCSFAVANTIKSQLL